MQNRAFVFLPEDAPPYTTYLGITQWLFSFYHFFFWPLLVVVVVGGGAFFLQLVARVALCESTR